MRHSIRRGLGLLLCLALCAACLPASASDFLTPAIQDMRAYALDGQSIKISWHQTGSKWVHVFRDIASTSRGFDYITSLTVNVDGYGEWTDTGLTEGEAYGYRLTPYSYATYGSSVVRYAAALRKPDMVGIPTVVTDASGTARAVVTWREVAGADGYDLWKGQDERPLEHIMFVERTTTAECRMPDEFVSCSYMARAYVIHEGVRYFGPMGAHTALVYMPVSDSIPAPEMTAFSEGGEAVSLAWTHDMADNLFNVYRSEGRSLEKPLVATVTDNHFLDMGLETGTVYFYRVATVRGGARSVFSGEVWAAPMYRPGITSVSMDAHHAAGTLTVSLSWTEACRDARYAVCSGPEWTLDLYGERTSVMENTASLTLPLPSGPAEYSFNILPYVTAYDGTIALGPRSAERTVTYPNLGRPGDPGRFGFDGLPPWAAPWHEAWLRELLDTFADSGRWPREPLPDSGDLAQLAKHLLGNGELAEIEQHMAGALHPDGTSLLLRAYENPPEEQTAAELARLLDKLGFLLAGRAPEDLAGSQAEDYRKLLEAIHQLPGMGPAPQPTAKPTHTKTPGPNDPPTVTVTPGPNDPQPPGQVIITIQPFMTPVIPVLPPFLGP